MAITMNIVSCTSNLFMMLSINILDEATGETEKAPVRKQTIDLLDRSEAIKSYLKKGGNLPKTFTTQVAS